MPRSSEAPSHGIEARRPWRRLGWWLAPTLAIGSVAVVAGAALSWSGPDAGAPTGRIGRIDPPITSTVSVADLGTLAVIHTDSVNALRRCADEQRVAVARAGGDSHAGLYC